MFPRTLKQKMKLPAGASLREAVRVAWDLVTLGEATAASEKESQSAPTVDHPHRRALTPAVRRGRPGGVAARPQVCRTPLTPRPSRAPFTQRVTTEHH